MPHESTPHQRTWMAFGATRQLWGDLQLTAQQNIAAVANTIIQYEPLIMLVTESDYALAKKMLDPTIELVICPLNDIWIRDTGAIFVITPQGKKAAINFNFNGWGRKQLGNADSQVAQLMADFTHIPLLTTDLILEGGGIEVDGKGTAILTESCILNRNRNPFFSKIACEIELKRFLGLKKIIWLPGIKAKEITDGHIDCYARFTPAGSVIVNYQANQAHFDHRVTCEHLEILKNTTDADGSKLELESFASSNIVQKTIRNEDYTLSYLNYYVCNGAVIAQKFGDLQADNIIKAKLQNLFPYRKIEMLNINAISTHGGGIHCITQQEPMDNADYSLH